VNTRSEETHANNVPVSPNQPSMGKMRLTVVRLNYQGWTYSVVHCKTQFTPIGWCCVVLY
jgi:hypothetical protein